MKLTSKILTQDDIKVNFNIEMTVGEMKDILNDTEVKKFSGRAYDLMMSLKSIIREVEKTFYEPDGE